MQKIGQIPQRKIIFWNHGTRNDPHMEVLAHKIKNILGHCAAKKAMFLRFMQYIQSLVINSRNNKELNLHGQELCINESIASFMAQNFFGITSQDINLLIALAQQKQHKNFFLGEIYFFSESVFGFLGYLNYSVQEVLSYNTKINEFVFFKEQNLSYFSFEEIDLFGFNLSNTDLTNCHFKNTKIVGANIYLAKLPANLEEQYPQSSVKSKGAFRIQKEEYRKDKKSEKYDNLIRDLTDELSSDKQKKSIFLKFVRLIQSSDIKLAREGERGSKIYIHPAIQSFMSKNFKSLNDDNIQLLISASRHRSDGVKYDISTSRFFFFTKSLRHFLLKVGFGNLDIFSSQKKISTLNFFRRSDLSGMEFSELNLSGFDFSFCNLNKSNFNNCTFFNTIFYRSKFTFCQLENNTIKYVKFIRCNITGSNFWSNYKYKNIIILHNCLDENKVKTQVVKQERLKKRLKTIPEEVVSIETQIDNYTNYSISDSEIYEENFSGKFLRGANFQDKRFKKCEFDNANLSNSNFTNACFEKCKFDNANLSNSNFKNALFKNCSFSNSIFLNSLLIAARFENCFFENIYINNNSIKKCSFKDSTIQNSYLTNLNFNNVLFSNTKISNSDFSYNRFIDVNFKDVKFKKVSSNFSYFYSSFQSFCGFVLGNNLDGLNFDECNFDNSSFFQYLFAVIPISNSTFNHCSFVKTNMTSIEVKHSNFDSSTFEEAILNCSKFENSSFRNSRLEKIKIDRPLSPDFLLDAAFTKFIDVDLSDVSLFTLYMPKHFQHNCEETFHLLSISKQYFDFVDNISDSFTIKKNLIESIFNYFDILRRNIELRIELGLEDFSKFFKYAETFLDNPNLHKLFTDRLLPIFLTNGCLKYFSFDALSVRIFYSHMIENAANKDFFIKNSAFISQFIFFIRQLSKTENIPNFYYEIEKIYQSYLPIDFIGLKEVLFKNDFIESLDENVFDKYIILISSDESFVSIFDVEYFKKFINPSNFMPETKNYSHKLNLTEEETKEENEHRGRLINWDNFIVAKRSNETAKIEIELPNNLEYIFNQVKLFKTSYHLAAMQRFVTNFFLSLNLSSSLLEKFLESRHNKYSKVKMIDAENENKLIEAFKSFCSVDIADFECQGDAALNIQLSESAEVKLYNLFGLSQYTHKEISQFYICFGAFFCYLSCKNMFGTRGASPLPLRNFSIALLNKAIKFDETNKDNIMGWNRVLAGVKGTFDCTEILFTEMKNLLRGSLFFSQIIPPAWQ